MQRHTTWRNYAERELKAGRKPTKFKDWQVEPTYFSMISKQTAESQLKSSGLSQKEIDKFKPKKTLTRKKK